MRPTKTLIFTFFLLSILWNFPAAAQENPNSIQPPDAPPSEIYATAPQKIEDENTEPPQFPGGIDSLRNFIYSSVIYPEAAVDSLTQGTVLAMFIVEKDGSVSDIQIERGLPNGIDDEVKRVLRRLPKFSPATKEEEPVRFAYRIPITFRLED